jgi:hypothetical protein
MDDSHEVIINTTPSRDIEGDQDSTLPLNYSFIELNVVYRIMINIFSTFCVCIEMCLFK